MTTQALRLRDDATRWERLRHNIAAVPWHGIRRNGNQFLITSGAVYAGAMFNMQHDIFPPVVAVALAGGFEWTYLAGIALASDTRKGTWGFLINLTGMLTSLAFGMLYIIGVYDVIPEKPAPYVAVALAAAHIIPITLMSFFYAMAHRAHQAQHLADSDSERQRQQTREDQQHAIEQQWRQEKLQIELERERLALERERARLNKSRGATAETTNTRPCPKCGAPLTAGQYSVAHRYGYCKGCKGT